MIRLLWKLLLLTGEVVNMKKKKDAITDKCVENAIEWIDGNKRVCATITTKSFKKRVYQIAKTNPLLEIVAENEDGSILVKFPLKWVKINPGRSTKEESDVKEEKPKKKKTLSPEHLAKMQAGRKKADKK